MGLKLRVLVIAAGMLLLPALTQAACPPRIVAGEIQTSVQTLAPGENCVVEAGGSIAAAGTGIYALGNNRVVNDGSIETAGRRSASVYTEVGVNSIVVNNGTIVSSGPTSNALRLRGPTTLINTGTIDSSSENVSDFGLTPAAISGRNNLQIINSGTIIENLAFQAIELRDGGEVQNNGLIQSNNYQSTAISFGDNNIIQNTGTIDAPWGLERGYDNKVVNTGTIISDGPSIRLGEDNNLINSGYIKTLNSGAIRARNGSFIENNGTIDSSRTVTFRGNPGGISVSENSFIVNNGNITINGDVGTGVGLRNNSLLVNDRLISVVGEHTGGVDLNRATFVNNGVVAASGLQSVAVDGIVGSEIVNHGSLTAVGEISQGVRMGSRSTIHNFGTISAVGTNAMAIHMSSDNEIYLGQGSLLIGDIRVSGNANTLNTSPGKSQSLDIIYGTNATELLVGDTGSLPHASSPIVPHPSRPFTRTNRIAVLDPTNLAADDELLADLASAVFAARPRSFANGNARDAASREPRDDFSVWADGFGSYRNMEGKDAAVGSSLILAGGALGVDRLVGERSRFGAFVGGARATIAADFESQTTKSDTVFAGLYLDTETDDFRVNSAIAAGYSDFSWDRRVAANTSPSGLTTATGD